MGKVSCFALAGLDCVFYSNDHLPHHFHVIKESKWKIRVLFMLTSEASRLCFKIDWQKDKKGPSSAELAAIGEMVIAHKVALLKEWEEKVKRD